MAARTGNHAAAAIMTGEEDISIEVQNRQTTIAEELARTPRRERGTERVGTQEETKTESTSSSDTRRENRGTSTPADTGDDERNTDKAEADRYYESNHPRQVIDGKLKPFPIWSTHTGHMCPIPRGRKDSKPLLKCFCRLMCCYCCGCARRMDSDFESFGAGKRKQGFVSRRCLLKLRFKV
eukprot:gb/GECG01006781.1/.p1 GENE.gb/GECG01006781.1/~~gb/GECG01006781.1/.p1  ORF type:complete len:181 (+),score=17.62 gb/GECG01006781.1/:1-543(+)